MNRPTIYDATADGPVKLVYDETVYEFARQKPGLTIPNFAGGVKVSGPGRDLVVRNWTDRLPFARDIVYGRLESEGWTRCGFSPAGQFFRDPANGDRAVIVDKDGNVRDATDADYAGE